MAMIKTRVMPDGTTLLQVGTAAGEQISGDQTFDGKFYIDDEIRGGGGSDSLDGSTGQNDLFGQGGDDFLYLGSGKNDFDRGFGGKGNDSFTIAGAPGSTSRLHLASGGSGYDKVYLLAFSTGFKTIGETLSVAGTRIAKLASIESIQGSQGDDIVKLSGDIREVSGSLGNDTLDARAASKYSYLHGGGGNDILWASAEGSYLIDGDELDPAVTSPRYYDDSDVMKGGEGADTLVSISGDDQMRGGDWGDNFYSIGGRDRMLGGKGDDVFDFALANAKAFPSPLSVTRAQAGLVGIWIDGGKGRDRVDFSDTYTSYATLDNFLTLGVEVDLGVGIGRERGTGRAGQFTIKNVEDLYGTKREDVLIGSDTGNHLYGLAGKDILAGRSGADRLVGGKHADELFGGAHDDYLYGGAGRDIYTGGSGADQFAFGTGTSKRPDRVTDFNRYQGDKFIISDGATGNATKYSELKITDTAKGALVAYGAGSFLVENTTAATLTDDLFSFFG